MLTKKRWIFHNHSYGKSPKSIVLEVFLRVVVGPLIERKLASKKRPKVATMDNMTCDKPYTSTDKWTASVISGLTFLIMSSPYTYSLTNSLVHTTTKEVGGVLKDVLPTNVGGVVPTNGAHTTERSGCPSTTGILIHSVAYMFIIRIMMEKRNLAGCKKPYNSKDKWITSAVGGLMFLVVSSPFCYKLTDGLISNFGVRTVDEDGCPNMNGLLLHTAAFIVSTRLLMY